MIKIDPWSSKEARLNQMIGVLFNFEYEFAWKEHFLNILLEGSSMKALFTMFPLVCHPKFIKIKQEGFH